MMKDKKKQSVNFQVQFCFINSEGNRVDVLRNVINCVAWVWWIARHEKDGCRKKVRGDSNSLRWEIESSDNSLSGNENDMNLE